MYQSTAFSDLNGIVVLNPIEPWCPKEEGSLQGKLVVGVRTLSQSKIRGDGVKNLGKKNQEWGKHLEFKLINNLIKKLIIFEECQCNLYYQEILYY